MPIYAKRQDIAQKPICAELKARGIAIVSMPDPGDVLTFRSREDVARRLQKLFSEFGSRVMLNLTQQDFLDIIARCQQWMPIEFKTPRPTRGDGSGGSHGLTKKQEATRAAGVPIPIVKSLGEALALFGLEE